MDERINDIVLKHYSSCAVEFDFDGGTFDLTGKDVYSQIRNNKGELIATFDVTKIYNADTGKHGFILELSEADVLAIPLGQVYKYDVKIVDNETGKSFLIVDDGRVIMDVANTQIPTTT